MLTAVQRADILGLTAESELDRSDDDVNDDDIWYDFLSLLFRAGKTLKDLKLNRSQKAEIMACLRQAPPVAPRTFARRGGDAGWSRPTVGEDPKPPKPLSRPKPQQ